MEVKRSICWETLLGLLTVQAGAAAAGAETVSEKETVRKSGSMCSHSRTPGKN